MSVTSLALKLNCVQNQEDFTISNQVHVWLRSAFLHDVQVQARKITQK
jgi:hypothetical protein